MDRLQCTSVRAAALDEEVEVAQDERRLGEDGKRVAGLTERRHDPPGEVIAALGTLVGVGVGAHGDVVATPVRRAQLGAHAVHGVHLHHQLAVEVLADVEPQVLVRRSGEAVRTGVTAPAVGVDGEAERHLRCGRHLVDDTPRVDVEELEAPILAHADMSVDELLLGKEHGLAAVVVGPPPPERHGLAHGAMVSNTRSMLLPARDGPGRPEVGRSSPIKLGVSAPPRHLLPTSPITSRSPARGASRPSPGGSFLRATGAGVGLAALAGTAWELAERSGPSGARHRSAGRGRGSRPRTKAGAVHETDTVRMVTLDSGVSVPSADWVVAENQLPGTLDWVMSATKRIFGYSDHVSAVHGDTVTLFVDPPPVPYRVELYRMGYYGGLGGRLVWRSPTITGGTSQPPPTVSPDTFMVECQWQPTTTVHVDPTWPPGAYLFKLTGTDNGATAGYIPLCVRDDDSSAAFVVMHSVTTWQAYNAYGGRSLYIGPGTVRVGETGAANRSRVVSFDRPYDQRGWGAPDFMGNEFPLVFLAERLGLDVTYITDIDLHQSPDALARHRCLFSLGHDEYWSSTMRDGATRALTQGVNLAFLGANAVYRHIRLEPSPLGQDRRQVCYKTDLASEDPLSGTDPAEVTYNWPDGPVPRPEQELVGSQYVDVEAKADMVVADAGAWIFAGTGLSTGQHLAQVVEGEYDCHEPGSRRTRQRDHPGPLPRRQPRTGRRLGHDLLHRARRRRRRARHRFGDVRVPAVGRAAHRHQHRVRADPRRHPRVVADDGERLLALRRRPGFDHPALGGHLATPSSERSGPARRVRPGVGPLLSPWPSTRAATVARWVAGRGTNRPATTPTRVLMRLRATCFAISVTMTSFSSIT